MLSPQEDKAAADGKQQGLRRYFARDPVILALLVVSAIAFFLAVAGLSRLYHGQQEALGNRWFTRGVADLEARRYQPAVVEFRAALLYSRDNYSYQLNLAQALIGLKRTAEADAYLLNLWDRQPENGLVNVELARIAAEKGETEPALRYYHNAIYATWPGDKPAGRRGARLELIAYLLKIDAKAQAQSELIALAANLNDDPVQEAHIADFFLEAQDYEHALAAYRMSLESDRDNATALAGAGRAAFELARYPMARGYLQAAVAAAPGDAQSAARLKTTELVLRMDPFLRHTSAAQRDRTVIDAFTAAGKRLESCAIPIASASGNTSQQGLAESWTKMKPRITERGLRQDADLAEAAMDLVFSIERQTSTTCGAPAGADLALLLIARLHTGS